MISMGPGAGAAARAGSATARWKRAMWARPKQASAWSRLWGLHYAESALMPRASAKALQACQISDHDAA
jgi:hypothetical protein